MKTFGLQKVYIAFAVMNKSMEHYRELMGMLAAFDHVEQELKSLLNKQEQIDE